MPDLTRLGTIGALDAPSKRDDLVRARLAIHSSVPLQKLFELAETERWDAERLAASLEWNFAIVHGLDIDSDVCRYLAEEFAARDKTKTLLVSAETGLAVAQVSQEAIYVPEPVAREGSDQLAVPLPRLKPEIEAAIIRHRNAVAEEPLLISKLEERAQSSALQRVEGDTRLRISTRGGRKKVAERLREELPNLMRDHDGLMGRFFAWCRINEPVPEACTTHLPLILRAHASILVADALAMNFRHDPYRALKERTRAGWGRWLARVLTVFAHQSPRTRAVTIKDTLPSGLLIGSPDLAKMAGRRGVLPVPALDAQAVTVAGPLFLVVAEDAYDFESYETAGRWCVDTSVAVDLYLDATSLHPWVFTDLIESGLVAEVFS